MAEVSVNSLADRGLQSAAVLAEAKPHGVRLRYMAGCRCLKCRMANSNYEKMRARARKAGDWNGIVDAADARRHIRNLSRQGVGYKMVAAAASVATSVTFAIRQGKRTRVRARTAKRILAVTIMCRGDAALVSAAATWRRINELLDEGFTRGRIATELGRKTPALQICKDRVTVRTAASVEALHARYMR